MLIRTYVIHFVIKCLLADKYTHSHTHIHSLSHTHTSVQTDGMHASLRVVLCTMWHVCAHATCMYDMIYVQTPYVLTLRNQRCFCHDDSSMS